MKRPGICDLVRLLDLVTSYIPEPKNGEIYIHRGDQADKMPEADKYKVYYLSEEIVKDIGTLMRQPEGLKQEHGNHLLFELGSILGQIKEKYKRQVDIYRQLYNKHANISTFMSPEDGLRFRPAHFIIGLEFITAKQLEIEQLVEICLNVPREDLIMYTRAPQKIHAPKPPKDLRTRPMRQRKPSANPPPQDPVEQEFNRMAQEERLKMRLRAEYNKRHGNKGNRK